VAGYQITRDIAVGLGLPFDIAEEMKKRYGSVMPVYETKLDTPTTISQDGHGVSYQDLCDIVRARVDEVIRLILLEMPRSEYASFVPCGLVLTGGSSNLAGIEALGRDILRLPVRIGVPTNIYGIADILHDPSYATSVGLLLWGAKNKGLQAWHGKRRFGIRQFVSAIKKLFR
jgi:cell division protein FtsA